MLFREFRSLGQDAYVKTSVKYASLAFGEYSKVMYKQFKKMPGNAREDPKSGAPGRWDHKKSWQRIWLSQKHYWWAKIECQINHKQSWECSRIPATTKRLHKLNSWWIERIPEQHKPKDSKSHKTQLRKEASRGLVAKAYHLRVGA